MWLARPTSQRSRHISDRLQKINEFFDADIVDVVRPVLKTKSPNGNHGFSLVVEIGLVCPLRGEFLIDPPIPSSPGLSKKQSFAAGFNFRKGHTLRQSPAVFL